MMGNYHGAIYPRWSPYMMGGQQYFSWVQLFITLLVILDLVLLAVWLWKQVRKK